ncbi:hypothetical protein GCM10010428_72080 [Actinosynnema pretiosum subsp. pretiosum]
MAAAVTVLPLPTTVAAEKVFGNRWFRNARVRTQRTAFGLPGAGAEFPVRVSNP